MFVSFNQSCCAIWLLRVLTLVYFTKALLEVKENLHRGLGPEPTEGELAEATNMTVVQVRKHLEVGQAARNKLIKVTILHEFC